MKGEKLKDILKKRAVELGFDAMRVTKPNTIPDAAKNLRLFLENGYHASMDWLSIRSNIRSNPSRLWPKVRSVLLVAMNYGQKVDALAHLSDADSGGISIYARNRDYHNIVKGRLKELASVMVAKGGGDAKVFVDTAPVMEKPLAASAGIGWQGKHTNLVSRELGSWFFLGAIFTSLELPADLSETDHCGNCRACLDSCPTGAFPEPYQLDARRCISYLTIEHKGHIPYEFRKAIGNRIYGCDDCLAVCPWNKFAHAANEVKLQARKDLNLPRLGELLTLTDTSFRKMFSASPIKRIGRDRFIRNVLIAAGNSGNTDYLPQIERLLEDESPLVQLAAVWALGELAGRNYCKRIFAKQDTSLIDKNVLAEWDRIL